MREATFQSVILAGVYDIKNIKLKLRADEQRSYNSPWNIAASFDDEFIIELKIWHEERMNEKAKTQLCGYLDSRHKSKGLSRKLQLQ